MEDYLEAFGGLPGSWNTNPIYIADLIFRLFYLKAMQVMETSFLVQGMKVCYEDSPGGYFLKKVRGEKKMFFYLT